jgi:hypothetical protein
MSKPELQQIAEESTFQIHCAMSHVKWLRGTLHVLKDRLLADPKLEHYATLADLAIYNADDWHNQLDCERESLESRLKAVEEALK